MILYYLRMRSRVRTACSEARGLMPQCDIAFPRKDGDSHSDLMNYLWS